MQNWPQGSTQQPSTATLHVLGLAGVGTGRFLMLILPIDWDWLYTSVTTTLDMRSPVVFSKMLSLSGCDDKTSLRNMSLPFPLL